MRFIAIVLLLAILYILSLQDIPNGSSEPYMIDVGETQVALNVWGTLHATGYPLYTIVGNLFTPLARIFTNPAAAASLFSTLWTLLALAGFVLLLRHLNAWAILAGLLLLGLTRSVWLHSVVAEVYSMSLALVIALYALALWPDLTLRQRVWGLAFVGGIGFFHHRAVAFGALGLFFAIWPQIRQTPVRQTVRIFLLGIPIALIGFLPYLYLPLRVDAEWSYSRDVDTWDGFWFHFMGREADYLITSPDTLQGWIDNLGGTLDILMTEWSLVGFVIALGSVIVANVVRNRIAHVVTLGGIGHFLFAVAYHQAVLPEAILMMTLPTFAACVALTIDYASQRESRLAYWGLAGATIWALVLFGQHQDYIRELTTDETGLEAIASADVVPRDENPVFMLSWGPRYFAASYSRLVTEDNADLPMVDHRADFAAIASAGQTFFTQPDTLFGYPAEWWAQYTGKVYLSSAGENLVRIADQPRILLDGEGVPIEASIEALDYQLICTDDDITLVVAWYATQQPDRDLRVFVHLLDGESPFPLEQADQIHPVYGWRPTSTWLPDEVVTDHYTLARDPRGQLIVFGMYEAISAEEFVNYGEIEIPVSDCSA